MKNLSVFLCAMGFVFGVVGTANSALINNLNGTITQIRNDGSRLMWLQDANTSGSSMNWSNAVQWADQLEYAGFDDWRLPQTLPVNGIDYDFTHSYDGSTDIGFNITSLNSELGYMYHVELGNFSLFDINGDSPQSGWETFNAGPFANLNRFLYINYWSGTEINSIYKWAFCIDYGEQVNIFEGTPREYVTLAWAVREMSPVPIPSAVWLLGSGLIGVVGFRRKFRK